MTDRELNIVLREMARTEGLCKERYSRWPDDGTIDECLDRYVRGFDFACRHDYPPLAFIRKHFRIDDLHRHHIYIDEPIDMEASENGFYIFLGSCRGRLAVADLKAVTVYVRHDCIIDVSAADGAKVFVSYYDRSSGDCASDGYSVIRKYLRKSNKD